MPDRWTFVFGGLAIVCLCAEPVQSAQPPGRAVGTETMAEPPDDMGIDDPGLGVPDPESLDEDVPSGEEDTIGAESEVGETGETVVPPEVRYDTDELPAPVRRLREQIIEAARTGDIEKLRPVFEANGGPPAIFSAGSGDPIEDLRSLAGDAEGREILAILIEVLEAGYVHVDVGTPEEMYIWPYFARYPLDSMTGPQMVELFKILTAGDYEDMKIYDVYLFYRVGIDPRGIWRYFLAGD